MRTRSARSACRCKNDLERAAHNKGARMVQKGHKTRSGFRRRVGKLLQIRDYSRHDGKRHIFALLVCRFCSLFRSNKRPFSKPANKSSRDMANFGNRLQRMCETGSARRPKFLRSQLLKLKYRNKRNKRLFSLVASFYKQKCVLHAEYMKIIAYFAGQGQLNADCLQNAAIEICFQSNREEKRPLQAAAYNRGANCLYEQQRFAVLE